jgi:predicted TIM-barrel fold metal-dependent hydrolase
MARSTPLGSDWADAHPTDIDALVATLTAGGVHGAVLAQAVNVYGFDNSYVADARAAAPGRVVGLSVIDMAAADRVERLSYWSKDRGLGGTRLFNIPPSVPSWLGTGATAEVLQQAEATGVRVVACVLPADLPALDVLLEQAGEWPVALDHCGFAAVGDDHSPSWPALTALARHQNLRLKVTTTLLRSIPESTGDARAGFERLCDAFGVERLMWGSDYPQHYAEPYEEHVALARSVCAGLSAADQARFLGGTALELWPELEP